MAPTTENEHFLLAHLYHHHNITSDGHAATHMILQPDRNESAMHLTLASHMAHVILFFRHDFLNMQQHRQAMLLITVIHITITSIGDDTQTTIN